MLARRSRTRRRRRPHRRREYAVPVFQAWATSIEWVVRGHLPRAGPRPPSGVGADESIDLGWKGTVERAKKESPLTDVLPRIVLVCVSSVSQRMPDHGPLVHDRPSGVRGWLAGGYRSGPCTCAPKCRRRGDDPSPPCRCLAVWIGRAGVSALCGARNAGMPRLRWPADGERASNRIGTPAHGPERADCDDARHGRDPGLQRRQAASCALDELARPPASRGESPDDASPPSAAAPAAVWLDLAQSQRPPVALQ